MNFYTSNWSNALWLFDVLEAPKHSETFTKLLTILSTHIDSWIRGLCAWLIRDSFLSHGVKMYDALFTTYKQILQILIQDEDIWVVEEVICLISEIRTSVPYVMDELHIKSAPLLMILEDIEGVLEDTSLFEQQILMTHNQK